MRFQSLVGEASKEALDTGRLRPAAESSRQEVSGRLLARWLAKTYCNVMTVAKRRVNEDFVAFSFDHSTQGTVQTYMQAFVGSRIKIEQGHVSAQDYYSDDGDVLWCVRLAGFLWLVSTLDLGGIGDYLETGDSKIPVSQFLLHPNGFWLGSQQIRISW
ncbi:MAG: hypothetical protein IH989_03395 [Planctomycetes bacterium]|nr:hypothetical protein [Planctomycetota bacterium]